MMIDTSLLDCASKRLCRAVLVVAAWVSGSGVGWPYRALGAAGLAVVALRLDVAGISRTTY
jgi:hypothetical protein